MIAGGLEPLLKWRKINVVLGLFILYQVYHTTEGIQTYAARTSFAIEVKNYLDSKCPEKTIIPIEENVTELDHNVPFVFYTQFVRNAFFNGRRLYARNITEAGVLKKYFPEYSICGRKE